MDMVEEAVFRIIGHEIVSMNQTTILQQKLWGEVRLGYRTTVQQRATSITPRQKSCAFMEVVAATVHERHTGKSPKTR